jgi:hypothetical protein
MKKILLIVLLIAAFVDVASAAQKGSHRVGGCNSHGKGSHYVGGH